MRALVTEEQRRATAERETAQLRDQVSALAAEVAEAGRVQARQQGTARSSGATACRAVGRETSSDLADSRAELGRTQTELRAAVADRTALQTRAEALAGDLEQA